MQQDQFSIISVLILSMEGKLCGITTLKERLFDVVVKWVSKTTKINSCSWGLLYLNLWTKCICGGHNDYCLKNKLSSQIKGNYLLFLLWRWQLASLSKQEILGQFCWKLHSYDKVIEKKWMEAVAQDMHNVVSNLLVYEFVNICKTIFVEKSDCTSQ